MAAGPPGWEAAACTHRHVPVGLLKHGCYGSPVTYKWAVAEKAKGAAPRVLHEPGTAHLYSGSRQAAALL